MYKSKLQELCQRRSWELPEYTTVKDGPDHMPRFTAAVNVQGQVFETPAQCKSAKEAQNTVARIAFDHFSVPPPSAANDLPPSIPAPAATVNSQFHPGAPLPMDTPVAPLPMATPVAPLPEIQPMATPVAPLPESQPVGAASPLLPLSPLPSSLPDPPPGLLQIKNDANTQPANEEVLQDNCEDTQSSIAYTLAIGSHDKCYKDMLHMYKNQLQQYAQKENLGFPVYTSEAQGPPHARRFKSRVSVDGKSFETLEFFPTLKEAEQAAAKAACQALSVDVIQEDGGLYKNLLQEVAQKKGFLCPSYETVSSGLSHRPIFVSTVAVGTDTFPGAEAKTKKLAEMNAAKVAYFALTKGCAAMESPKVSSVNECPVADNLSQNIQPITTIKKHDTTNEEAHLYAKRAKPSPENMNVSSPKSMNVDSHHQHPSHGNPPSDGLYSQVENSISAESVTKQCVEGKPLLQWKTVVFPRKSSLPIPERASVMPYSNNQWVAYKVELDKEATA